MFNFFAAHLVEIPTIISNRLKQTDPAMLTEIPTEQSTAFTDFLLFAFSAGIAFKFFQFNEVRRVRSLIWTWTASLHGFAAFVGTFVHGFIIPDQLKAFSFSVIFLSLGLSVAGFVIAAVYDLLGEKVAIKYLPYAIATAISFHLVTVFFDASFLFFIAYEATAMLFALFIYLYLWKKGFDGAAYIIGAILVAIIAATIQATGILHFDLIWSFDHNGIFHMVQVVSILLLFQGVRRSF